MTLVAWIARRWSAAAPVLVYAGLGDVEPVHDPLLRLAAGGEGPLVADPAGAAAGEEVVVEREDDVGLVEVVDRVDVLAEGELGAGLGGVAVGRLVAVPLRLGEGGEELLDLAPEARRADGLGQDPQPGPLLGAEPVHLGGQGCEEVVPGADLPLVEDDLRPVGVIQLQRGRLHEDVGRAEARRVFGVPLDLGRPPLVAFHQDAGPEAADGHRRGEELRLAGHDVLGRLDPGDDLLGGPDGAPGDPRQGERGPHDLEERPARFRVGQLARLVGELAVEVRLERFGPRRFLQAPPELRPVRRGQPVPDLGQVDRGFFGWQSHRWQIEQLSSRPTSIP